MTSRRLRLIVCLAVCSLAGPLLQPLSAIDIESHVYISSLSSAEAPSVRDGAVLFTYKSRQPPRYVGVAFEHESFKHVWTFSRNSHGVYVLLYTPPSGLDTLVYRYVVDGLWMADPNGPEQIAEPNGITMSRVSIRGAFPVEPKSPVIVDHDRVRLFYQGPAGRRVYVSGDFTNWDPFLYHLSETQPGQYSLEITLAPGIHRYVFVVDGTDTVDPLNPRTMVRADGLRVSVVSLR